MARDEPGGLAAFVRRLRLRAGLTQEALAERAGLTVDTVGALERGRRRRLYPHTAHALADALGLTEAERADLAELAHGPIRTQPAPSPAPTAPSASPDAPLHNLPAPLTSFVGRERELAAVALMLAGGTRLLTLTGPGGAGKTRLALAAAERLRDRYPDRVCFVDLSPVADPNLVAGAIAQALGVREHGSRPPAEALADYLGGRRALLLLDNFEQLVEGAPLLTLLLRACPELTVLVTSRAALRISGEREYTVPPLPLPKPAQVSDLAALSGVPAVALFVQRAQAVNPAFSLTEENAAAVAAICARLDGLPLALELAAARSRILSPQALLARLDRRLPLLTGGARDLPARQRTLRDTITWSYDLLNPMEQALLRRLAVFVGGCTLAAAEAVCDADGRHGLDVLNGLGSLGEHSLLRREAGAAGEPRFTMLETVREYGLEQLAADDEQPNIQRAHAEYMLQLARSARRGMTGPAQAEWVRRLELEHHNLRAAFAWALAADEAELALRLCAALTTFWYIKGYCQEGRDWSARALAAAPDAAPARRAAVLFGAANLADIQHDHVEARAHIEASVALWRTVGDRRGLASSLSVLGMLARHDRDWATARRACEEALAIYAESPEPWGQRLALGVLGWVAEDQGDHATARRLLEASLAVARTGKSPIDIALQLNNLGIVAIRQGDDCEAEARHGEALRLTRDVDAREPMACALEGLAAVAAARRDHRRAAWLLGASAELRAEISSPRIAQFEEEYNRLLPLVQEALGDDAFAAAEAEGRALGIDAAVELALADLRPAVHAPSGAS